MPTSYALPIQRFTPRIKQPPQEPALNHRPDYPRTPREENQRQPNRREQDDADGAADVVLHTSSRSSWASRARALVWAINFASPLKMLPLWQSNSSNASRISNTFVAAMAASASSSAFLS